MDTYENDQCESGATDYRYDMSYIRYPSQDGVITGLAYQGYDWVHPGEGSPGTRRVYTQGPTEHIEAPYGTYLSYPSPQTSDAMQISPPTYFHPGYTASASIGFSRAEQLYTGAPVLPCGPSVDSMNRQTNAHKPKRRRVQTVVQRKAANIRERRRMFHLNEAFDELRKRLPAFNYEKRLSRIETLRLAMTYISFMQSLSEGKDPSEVQLLKYRRSDDYDDSNSDEC